jgi:DegV family protein with EDD domain
MVETMEYLYKGGRCSALQAVVGSMLKIRPIIEVRRDGTMGVKEKVRGPRQKGLQSILDDFAAHVPELDRKRVFITHAGCDADVEFLRGEVERLAHPGEIRVTLTGGVISSHCGPGTIGVLYMVK